VFRTCICLLIWVPRLHAVDYGRDLHPPACPPSGR
jgi:hypothetical protein